MKKILTVYTGGTICCEATGKMRDLNPELAKRALVSNFASSNSEYAYLSSELFEDSGFDEKAQTLSENMTLKKLSVIIRHIKSFSLDKYSGIIVMHGTDTLAFTASMFSFVFSSLNLPVMLVSGNRPPSDEKSNANDNFKTAVELIMNGISPNVYVPYKNSDGKILVHLGTSIMQCNNFSEDFYGAFEHESIILCEEEYKSLIEKFRLVKKTKINFDDTELINSVLYIRPYTGLDYSKISLDGINAVVHGTYHSGTFCVEDTAENSCSVLYLAKECDERNIPLFIAPSELSSDQYSSVYRFVNNSNAELLKMTSEAVYAKAIIGVSKGFTETELVDFVKS